MTVRKMPEREKETEVPQDVGTDRAWLKALAEINIEKPKNWSEKDVKTMIAIKPKSKIQSYLQKFCWVLQDMMREIKVSSESGEVVEHPDEDMFDGWYEEQGINEYPRSFELFQFFNTIARALHLNEESGVGDKSDFSRILSKIAMKVVEEPEYLAKVGKVINDKYPGLISEFRSMPTIDELNQLEAGEYEREINRIDQLIESNVEELAPELAKINKAKKTNFEITAQDLNRIVIFGEANWELILYGIMSPYAPRVLINNLDYRQNINTLLAGDISTAKSKIHKIAKVVSPKMLVIDETTKASFEGVAPTKAGEEIEEGIIDKAKDGIVVIEELNRKLTEMTLWRRFMDGEYIQIWKKGSTKGLCPNTSVLAACNPDSDFFIEETGNSFRRQIPFKEGVLSRFDIVIPLTATQVKNEILADKINLMSPSAKIDGIDLNAIKEDLMTLSQGMKAAVKRVVLKPEQQQTIKEAFKQLNKMDMDKRILKNRPLIVLRDLETLARLVNTISSVNFSKRKIKNGILLADDSDISKAIQLWENLMQFRVQLYRDTGSRNLLSVADEIILYILHSQKYRQDQGLPEEVPVSQIIREFVEVKRTIGKTTFYEELKGLRESGRIIQHGKRDGSVKIVIA